MNSKQQGFSLLEVMVSVAILSIIVLMLGNIFTGTTKAVHTGTDRVMLDRSATLILEAFETRLSTAAVRTNLAFLVRQGDGGQNEFLYYNSAHRKAVRSIAPQRFQPVQRSAPDWLGSETSENRILKAVYAKTGGGGSSSPKMAKTKSISAIYYKDGNPKPEFASYSPNENMETNSLTYTFPLPIHLDSGAKSVACLSFIHFAINGDSSGNQTSNQDAALPAGILSNGDMPRFVDITIGLISSQNLEMALRIGRTDQARSRQYIDNHLRIYTRRAHIRNRGADQLEF